MLVNIREPALPKLVEIMQGDHTSIKGLVARIFAWMGTEKSKKALEQAIEMEIDENLKKEFEDALIQWRRRG